MAVIVGSDGAVEFDFGNGMKCVADIFSWEAPLKRSTLRRTTQADEAERRTGGLADFTGSFSMRLEFSDDESVAQSAWQILNFAITNTDDDLKANLNLVLQRYTVIPDCDIFQSGITGSVSLSGVVVITDVSLNCSDPEKPLICEVAWEADGPLTLVRD